MITTLMHQLPPPLRVYFPELFALIGSREAIAILRSLIEDPHCPVRLSAIVAAAHHARDDLLTSIRPGLTHPYAAEQEICAYAVGVLKDNRSVAPLAKLLLSPHPSVRIAAAYSLVSLGYREHLAPIVAAAQKEDPFAILLLGQLPDTSPLLKRLIRERSPLVQLNATYALLKQKEPACLPPLLHLLVDPHLYCIPFFSQGGALAAWKPLPSARHHPWFSEQEVHGHTLALKEELLKEAAELPEECFIEVAQKLFSSNLPPLIPLLVHLLENRRSPAALALLSQQTERPGAPLIRTYSHLALYRLGKKEEHLPFLLEWLEAHHQLLIAFRDGAPPPEKQPLYQPYVLTLEESSRLLIEILSALLDNRDLQLIDILIRALGHSSTQTGYVLAGLLLASLS